MLVISINYPFKCDLNAQKINRIIQLLIYNFYLKATTGTTPVALTVRLTDIGIEILGYSTDGDWNPDEMSLVFPCQASESVNSLHPA